MRLAPAALWLATTPFTTGCAALGGINLFSPAQDVELGAQSYEQILAEERIITSGDKFQMVERATARLVESARHYDPEIADLFEWEVKLIDNDETVNAFCLPGGKMAVYSGILPVAETETGLAVVMGHEIAHATKRHGTEAVTRQLGISVLLEAIAGDNAEALGLASNLLVGLPMGRGAELEADREGLNYMAYAGYDPREAVAFWERMGQLGGGAPPEFLSTHPSHGRRIEQLQSLLPDAIAIYEQRQGLEPPPTTLLPSPETTGKDKVRTY